MELKMSRRKLPPRLSVCALDSWVQRLKSIKSRVGPEELVAIQKHLWIHLLPNLWQIWVTKLLASITSTERLKFLIIGPALEVLDLDQYVSDEREDFKDIQRASNIKTLVSKYAPFHWNETEIKLFQNSVIHLKNLEKLTLCYLNLTDTPGSFFEAIGIHCTKLRHLDLSNGIIPDVHFKAISQYCSDLEILIARSREGHQLLTRKLVQLLLVSLKKLKILDDDTGYWSCILPALSSLNYQSCALLEYMPVYDTPCFDPKYSLNVKRLLITSQAVKKSTPHEIWLWTTAFPSLRYVDFCFDNVPRLTVQNVMKSVPSKLTIQSIRLSRCKLCFDDLSVISKSTPNLKKLEIYDVQFIENESNPELPKFHCPKLKLLYYSGKLDDKIASFFLNGCANLRELHLKTGSLPSSLSQGNSLPKLQILRLDVHSVEVDYLIPIIRRASSLNQIRLPSKLSPQIESLQKQLTSENLHLLITN